MAAQLTLQVLAALLAASPQEASFDSFPAFVWRQDFQGETLPARIFAPFGGINVEGDGSVPRIEGQEAAPHFYVGHAPGREEFHLRRSDPWYDEMWQCFYEERDETLLVRQPCLSDPQTEISLLERLGKSLAARDGDWGSAVSLGDEIGLTPAGDPLDLCRSEHCEALAPWGGTSTDKARVAWLEDDTSEIGPWLARRRFHREVVHDLAASLAETIRALCPAAPRALFGVKTQTAFGGVDVPRALSFVDWIEPYGDTVTRELCFTLRRPEQRVFATLFPAGDRPERAALRLAEHVLRGGDGTVIWSDRHLARSPAYLERLARAVRDTRTLRTRLREIIGRDWAPRTSGWALLEDGDAVALSFLRDSLRDGPTWPRRFAGYQVEHGTREVAVRHWVDALEDQGWLPGALPFSALRDPSAAQWSERFPVLLLVEQAILSLEDEGALRSHLERGAVLVIQGRFAEFTENGERRSSPLAGWRTRYEGRVISGPESLGGVVSCALAASTAAERTSSVVPVASPHRVLRTELAVAKDKRIVALLPRPRTDEARVNGALLELQLQDGWRLEESLSPRVKLSPEEGNRFTAELPPAEALYLVLSQ